MPFEPQCDRKAFAEVCPSRSFCGSQLKVCRHNRSHDSLHLALPTFQRWMYKSPSQEVSMQAWLILW